MFFKKHINYNSFRFYVSFHFLLRLKLNDLAIFKELFNYISDIRLSAYYRKTLINYGMKEINLSLFNTINTKSTLFILGSGSTINDLSKSDWNTVKKNTSFGLNFFLAHEFIPNMYFYEAGENKALTFLFFKHFESNKAYNKIPLVLQGSHLLFHKYELNRFKNHYFQLPYRFKVRNQKMMRRLFNFKFFKPSSKVNQLIHHAGSISYLIDLGKNLGFKNIVLLGVDLNGPYFHEDRNDEISKILSSTLNISPASNKENIHLTADDSRTKHYGEISIDQYLKIYNKEVLLKENINLYVGSEKSLLSAWLPVYKF